MADEGLGPSRTGNLQYFTLLLSCMKEHVNCSCDSSGFELTTHLLDEN